MYYAYVLRNQKGLLYKGSTDDIMKRLVQHNSGEFPSYTAKNRPWKLVHYESFKTRIEAEKREGFFKTGKGREFLKKLIA
ncbi:MAG: hypothetical protein A2751_05005 [Candidatus Doudnabacteria bacterium RIFCSPHIGHO2_01_FULL_46_14]|uniref:GIY-YIG domain-containing protein n=1 Tax=Candidatus Doudnabacteria bacterium RIFCSPHIGHO2_01_FULL_46_14 TaxID=1817824 RepID=A0A1F5NNR1_9BACT|nr:MAG: hypothetical protein A2751_05005 [Candidatus Doudnabacteria bacterium RIFCSPHIGHO2_01_FULL_46_14]